MPCLSALPVREVLEDKITGVIVASEHNIPRNEKEKRFLRRITDRILSMVMDKTVTVSDAIKKDIKNYGLEGSVIFTGMRRDVTDLLTTIDIFMFSSIKEGASNSILEAMAMGKPIAATAVGGISEVAGRGTNGLLINPAEAEGLRKAIKL